MNPLPLVLLTGNGERLVVKSELGYSKEDDMCGLNGLVAEQILNDDLNLKKKASGQYLVLQHSPSPLPLSLPPFLSALTLFALSSCLHVYLLAYLRVYRCPCL